MLLNIRKNAQVTLPAAVRRAAHLEEGDVLDCEVHDGRIILTPKKIVDKSDLWFWSSEWQKAEAEAQKDIDSGNVRKFDTADDLIAGLSEE